MAFDEYLADRSRQVLKQKSVYFEEKKMMGGLCFMVDDKMCFGLLSDKSTGGGKLMCRVGPQKYEMALSRPHCSKMNFTGRTMNGFVFVDAEGFDTDTDLAYWIQLCLDFNPQATRSKKKKK